MSFISGLASGIDTASLIEQLMAIERRPIQLMQTKQSELRSKLDSYRDVNTRLNNLASRIGSLLTLNSFESRNAATTDQSVARASASASVAPGTYAVQVTSLATTHRIAADAQTDSSSALQLSGTVTINGKEIEITEDQSLTDIRNAINQADAGVVASIINHTLVLESAKTGSENQIQLVDSGSGGVLTSLGLLDGSQAYKNELQEARDSEFAINGIWMTRSGNTVADAVDGMTFTLAGVGSATVSVTRDVEPALNSIRSFVDQYNSVQNHISSLLKENGKMQGDFTLIQLQSSLRSNATSRIAGPVESPFSALADIGITIDRNGVMSVDENRLRLALEEDPASVRSLFAARAKDDGFDGIGTRLQAFIDQYTKAGVGIIHGREQMYQSQIESIQSSIDRLTERLELREATLVRQFLEMEKAIASAQNMSTALAGQLTQLVGFTRPSRVF